MEGDTRNLLSNVSETNPIYYSMLQLLKGSRDLVTRVVVRVTILITPIKVLITILTKSHDHPK